MRLLTYVGVLALSYSALMGCASTQQASFSGTVSNGGNEILNSSTLHLTLVDASTGTVVASKSMAVGGRRMPIAFTLTPREPLAPNGRYELRARIISSSFAVLYQSVQGVPVSAVPSGSVDVVVSQSSTGPTVGVVR